MLQNRKTLKDILALCAYYINQTYEVSKRACIDIILGVQASVLIDQEEQLMKYVFREII